MGLDDKIKNAAEKAVGSAKEAIGHATGNEELEAEGKTDKAAGGVKQVGEDVKDVFK